MREGNSWEIEKKAAICSSTIDISAAGKGEEVEETGRTKIIRLCRGSDQSMTPLFESPSQPVEFKNNTYLL